MSKSIANNGIIQHPIVQKIIQSRWINTALLVSFAACLIIGILASTRALHFIGTVNATYLACAMYGGAALFIILDVLKAGIKYYKPEKKIDEEAFLKSGRLEKRKFDSSTERLEALLSAEAIFSEEGINVPLEDDEIKRLRHLTPKFAENNYPLTTPKRDIEAAKQQLLEYTLDIVNSSSFKNNPMKHLKSLKINNTNAHIYLVVLNFLFNQID